VNKLEFRDKAWLDPLNEDFDKTMNYYSFLQEGDFERWQGFCYTDRNSEEWKKGYLNACWIINRFTEWGSPQWIVVNKIIQNMIKEVEMYGI